MSYHLSLDNLSGEAFLGEFTKIPPTTVKLDCSLNRFSKNSVEELTAFSSIPESVRHINLSSTDLYNMSSEKLKALFTSISKTNVISINLSKSGVDIIENQILSSLEGTLDKLERVIIDGEVISKMQNKSKEKLALLGDIFQNIKEVILIKNDGQERIGFNDNNALRRYKNAKKFGVNPPLPTLKAFAAYIVEDRSIPKETLPIELQEFCDDVGANGGKFLIVDPIVDNEANANKDKPVKPSCSPIYPSFQRISTGMLSNDLSFRNMDREISKQSAVNTAVSDSDSDCEDFDTLLGRCIEMLNKSVNK